MNRSWSFYKSIRFNVCCSFVLAWEERSAWRNKIRVTFSWYSISIYHIMRFNVVKSIDWIKNKKSSRYRPSRCGNLVLCRSTKSGKSKLNPILKLRERRRLNRTAFWLHTENDVLRWISSLCRVPLVHEVYSANRAIEWDGKMDVTEHDKHLDLFIIKTKYQGFPLTVKPLKFLLLIKQWKMMKISWIKNLKEGLNFF